jgi:hypothetical protein
VNNNYETILTLVGKIIAAFKDEAKSKIKIIE